jgi:hypothetical protein
VKFVQITGVGYDLYALDTQGRIWRYVCTSSYARRWEWQRIRAPSSEEAKP